MREETFWKDVPVLITGAAGFVGANLAQRLNNLGANVICLIRNTKKFSSLEALGIADKVEIIESKSFSVRKLESILSGHKINAVFHLAAKAIVNEANDSPFEAFEVNIKGTYSLLEACRKKKTVERIVVASSDRTYGKKAISPFHEDLPLLGLLPYDASKVCTDVIARSFAYSYDMPITVTRFSNIYGPGDLNFSRIIPGTIKSVLENQPPVIRSSGKAIREFVYIDDAVNGYLKMAEKIAVARGGAINFGSGQPISIIDLVEKIVHLSGKSSELKPVVWGDQTTFTVDAQYSSLEKAEKLLGWKNQVDIETGLRQTIEWYQQFSNF
jgi:CDP-glucose 4,6-dehydratase